MSQPPNEFPAQPEPIPVQPVQYVEPAAAPAPTAPDLSAPAGSPPAPAPAPAAQSTVAAPAVEPTVQTTPLQATPTVQTMPTVPASAPPMPHSGVPYSGMPYPGMPYGAVVAPAPKSKAALIFGILAGFFFLVAGVTGAAFAVQIAAANSIIEDQNQQIYDLRDDVKAKTSELTTAKSQLNTAADQARANSSELSLLRVCNTAVQKFFDAARDQDRDAIEDAINTMDRVC